MKITNKKYWLEQLMEAKPDKIGFVDKGKQFTYLQIWKLVKDFAVSLSNKGIKEKNHVAILSNNSIEFIIVVNALWLLGAVPVPLNIRLRPNEINKLLIHSESNFIIKINSKINFDKIRCDNKIDFSLNVKIKSGKINFVKFDKNRTAVLMYSSGSTGNPKCVQLSFNNLFSSFESFKKFIQCSPKDIWIASLPFYHIGGFSIITRSLLCANKIIFPKSFSNDDIAFVIEKENPTYLSLVSTTMKRLLDNNIKPNRNLKALFLGGGPITEKLITECLNNNYPIVKVYGSTETASMVTAISKKELNGKPFSVGKPLQNVKIEIKKENESKKTKSGEIVVCSGSVAEGYFNFSENLHSKIVNNKFFTGDYGWLDKEGYLYVEGRKDDIIISGGENIVLTEIEQFVQTIDFVEECATLKIPDKTWGESYLLFVALNKDDKSNEKNVLSKLKEKFAGFKLPKKIYIVSTIPRNQLGKVKKQELKKLLS